MAAGSIVVELLAKTGSFETDTARAGRALKKFQKDSEDTARAVKASFAGNLLAGFAKDAIYELAGIPARLAGVVTGAIDAADHLNDLSKKTGIAVDTLGGIGFAAKQSGSDLDSVAAAAGKLNKSLAEAAAGNKEAAEAFDILKISVKDAAGNTKTADVVMAELADKFAGYADGPEKAALALRLFGKAGADIIPLLDEGGAALQANIEYFKRYSGVTVETAKAADQFNDTQVKIKLLQESFGVTLASETLPLLQTLADRFLAAKEQGDGFKGTADGIVSILKGLTVAGAYVIDTFQGVGREIGAIGAQIALIKDALPAGGLSLINPQAAFLTAFARASNSAGFKGISEAVKADGVRAKGELDAFVNKVLNPLDLSGFAKTAASFGGGGKGSKPPAPRLSGDKTKEAKPKAERDDFGPLIRSLRERIDLEQAELDSETKLTEADRIRTKVLSDLSNGFIVLTEQQKKAVFSSIEELQTIDAKNKARENERKYLKEAGDENLRYLQKQDDVAKSLREQAADAQDLAATFGLTDDALKELTVSRTRDAAAALEQKAAQADLAYLDDVARLYREQAAALRDTADARELLLQKERQQQRDPLTGLRQGVTDYLDDIQKAGDATRNAVGQSLRSLEDVGVATLRNSNFKDLARNLVDQVINEFLRLAIIRPMMQQIFGSVGSASGIGSNYSGGWMSVIGAIGGLFAGNYSANGGVGYSNAAGISGGRAVGGPVIAGQAYTVGENGPETLVMGGQSGNVIPNGGRTGWNVNVINRSGAQVQTRTDENGDLEILLERAAEEGARRGHDRVAADFTRGTGRASSALKSRGVDLSGAIPRRS